MEQLTITARILAKADAREEVKREAIKLVEPTRKEEGCVYYNLFNDIDNPNLFIFQECWESLALLEKHLQSAHMVAFQQASDGKLEEFVVHKLAAIAE